MNATLYRPFPLVTDITQLAGALPSSVLDVFRPDTQAGTSITSLAAFAAVPKTSTFVVNLHAADGSNPSLDDAADADQVYMFGQNDGLGSLRNILAFAKRKPGTTGAVAAQTITVRKNDGSGTVLATVSVAAAAANADPVSTCYYNEWLPGGGVSGITAFHVDCSAGLDTDLMIVVVALGEQ